MCDEFTESENREWLDLKVISRRKLTAVGLGATTMAMLSNCMAATPSGADMSDTGSRSVNIETADGTADAFFAYPQTGTYPAIVMWPDVAGLRESYRIMGLQLARAGYAVLVVNHYYRTAKAPIFDSFSEWRTEEGQARLKPMREALSPAATSRDADAFISWLDRQKEVDRAKHVGSCGYCMGGPFTFRTAGARPDRVGAIASCHGAGLVTDTTDSPHLLMDKMKAAMLIAIAQNDDMREPDAKTILRDAADKTGLPAEIEVYPAQHGWCTIDSPVYDKVQAGKAWDRMLDTLAQHL